MTVRNTEWNRSAAPGGQTSFALVLDSPGDLQPGSALSCDSP
ncbi:hypothetical protein [Crossiella cryophila]|nr:hypothetical protein [Crossiella cryophila]